MRAIFKLSRTPAIVMLALGVLSGGAEAVGGAEPMVPTPAKSGESSIFNDGSDTTPSRAAPLPPPPPPPPATHAPKAEVLPTESPDQTFDRIYGERLRQVTQTEITTDDNQLGRQMMLDALQIAPGPLQHRMLHEASMLCRRGHAGGEWALECEANIIRLYPAEKPDRDEIYLNILEKMSHDIKKRDPLRAAAERYVNKIDEMAAEKLRDHQFNDAVDLYQRSIPAMRVIGADRLEERQALVVSTRQNGTLYGKIARLKDALRDTPDPVRATELVKTLLLDWLDPTEASDYLMLVDDNLRNVANDTIAGIASLNEAQAREMGAWYKAHYKESTLGKRRCLDRANQAYKHALALHAAHDADWLELTAAVREMQDMVDAYDRQAALAAKASKYDSIHHKAK